MNAYPLCMASITMNTYLVGCFKGGVRKTRALIPIHNLTELHRPALAGTFDQIYLKFLEHSYV